MPDLPNIPCSYKEGVYGVSDFDENTDAAGDYALSLDYDTQYQILSYVIPVGKDETREMTLYSVPEDDLLQTLRAVYDKDGTLQSVTATLNGHETLLYIHYENAEHARHEIQKFAIQNADAITEQIKQCTDLVARLFIEYYSDGDCMDYHAKIGTAAQMEALKQKYPRDNDVLDNAGDYPSDNIEGDNERLITMVRCAEDYPTETFLYMVDLMSKHIEEHALAALNKTEDFKYICAEYD
ncbi:MAG: hypothetical protein K2L86_02165 [Lachnospiraceae bacterium]|nr:hypothetical protein [Lachnospiraceae bacterium]